MQLLRWTWRRGIVVLCAAILLVSQLLLTGCALGQLIGGAPPPPGPKALYNALLNRSFATGETPPGLSSPEIQKVTPGSSLIKYDVLGGVEIDFSGPDASDSIVYWVFPAVTDAKGYFEEPFTGIDATFTPTSVLYPALCLTYSSSSNNGSYGVSACHVLVGNVEVVGVSRLRDESAGNDASAVALAQAGIAHLKAVQGQPR